VRFLRADAPPEQLRQMLAAYYSGFSKSKRARLDVKEFGPPLGEPAAPAALVEFSDYTCPFCQRIKPELDRFVRDNPERVRLYYKPFPIPSHARAMEAALAGEWARSRGLFWKMFDQLFAHPHALADDDLAGYARAIGGDPDDLGRAIVTGRDKVRVSASMAEARAAGIAGTPTLFLNGRKLDLPLGSDLADVLDFTLQDEEEWTANGGWAKD
jgi:protein-disulfide isomerase